MSKIIIRCKWDEIIGNIPDCIKDENGNFFFAASPVKEDYEYEILPLSELNVKYTYANCNESGIIVHASNKFNNTHLRVCDAYGANIIIGKLNKIINTNITAMNGYKPLFSMGDNNLVWGLSATIADVMENKIGNDCLFGAGLIIRAGQTHAIIDKITGDYLNKMENCVSIGNHVWTALSVQISGKASIANNCIIGAKSFVNSRFDETNCLIAGLPAKVIRRNVDWERSTPLKIITKRYCLDKKIPFSWKYGREALEHYYMTRVNNV